MMKTSRIDWQTVQKYIHFDQRDENRDSTLLLNNSKFWQYVISSSSIELMQY